MNIILSFDFIYQIQQLKKFLPDAYELNLASLEGVRGYCDNISADFLRSKLKGLSSDGIHFLGSGNYHYLSLFFLEKLSRPFSLVVFDHHTDMQPSMFGDLLSCGSWILNALETIQEVKELLIIGVGEESLQGTKETAFTTEHFSILQETETLLQCQYHNYKDYKNGKKEVSITILKEKQHYKHWQDLYKNYLHYPVFLSIDKDVLSKEELETDWDQGVMSKKELNNACKELLCHSPLLGIDICGEGAETNNFSQSLEINQKLIQLFQSEQQIP